MQTPTILPLVNVSSKPATGSKQTSSLVSDVPFNQVLSREVADHQDADNNSKSCAQDTDSVAAPQQAAANAATGSSASTKGTKSASDGKQKDDTDSTNKEITNIATASVDMLALVTNLGQTKLDPRTSTTVSDATPATNTDADTGKDDPAARIGLQILANNPQAVGLTEKNAPLKMEANFVAITTNANDTKQTADIKSAKTSIDITSTKTQELPHDFVATDKPPLDLAAKTPDISLTASAMPSLQPTAFNNLMQAAGIHQDKLLPSVGTAEWDQALGQKMVWMVAGEQQSASITLNPPDLGPLQVVLNVSNSQANATFIAHQPEVRQALEAALPKLREMLDNAGIQLGQATINAGMPNQHNAPGEQSRQNAHPFTSMDSPIEVAPRISQTRPISAGQGMVDTFA